MGEHGRKARILRHFSAPPCDVVEDQLTRDGRVKRSNSGPWIKSGGYQLAQFRR